MVKALVCGGGNGAHVLAGIASSQPNTEARVLTLYADEAERWNKAMQGGEFTISIHESGKVTDVKAQPTIVTKNPEEAVPDCDIIVLTVPAFAHAQYLEAIKPYLKPGMVIVGLPGRAGFEFAVWGILGDISKEITVMSFESLPWACRITEFGKGADVLGVKDTLYGAVKVGNTAPPTDPTEMLQSVLGKAPKLITRGHLLGITLMSLSSYIHTSIMYGTWKGWDGKPLDSPPLFYNGLDEPTANLLSAISDEVLTIAEGVMQQRPQVDMKNVTHVFQWYLRCYPDDIGDKTNLYTTIQTNRGYNGLKHPVEETPEGKFMPNFKYRYLSEDVPFGLVVLKGVAKIANIPTPKIDMVLTWAQSVMGKEYFVDGDIKGNDVPETRSPQKYGLITLDQALGL